MIKFFINDSCTSPTTFHLMRWSSVSRGELNKSVKSLRRTPFSSSQSKLSQRKKNGLNKYKVTPILSLLCMKHKIFMKQLGGNTRVKSINFTAGLNFSIHSFNYC